jgi:hypothetical protein
MMLQNSNMMLQNFNMAFQCLQNFNMAFQTSEHDVSKLRTWRVTRCRAHTSNDAVEGKGVGQWLLRLTPVYLRHVRKKNLMLTWDFFQNAMLGTNRMLT